MQGCVAQLVTELTHTLLRPYMYFLVLGKRSRNNATEGQVKAIRKRYRCIKGKDGYFANGEREGKSGSYCYQKGIKGARKVSITLTYTHTYIHVYHISLNKCLGIYLLPGLASKQGWWLNTAGVHKHPPLLDPSSIDAELTSSCFF